MLHTLESLGGFSMGATDGEIGRIKDFFFDDTTWTVRFLVVETGGWLFGRKVLISPQAVTGIDESRNIIDVNLTKDQIKHSPDVDTEQPVSRQHETELYNYYPWQSYWSAGLGGVGPTGLEMPIGAPIPPLPDKENTAAEKTEHNPHLRSSSGMDGYAIHATDGNIGEIEDYVLDDQTWTIKMLVVDTGNWLPGKKVLISPAWIKQIQWEIATVEVSVSKETIETSTVYDPAQPLAASYESFIARFPNITSTLP